MFCRCRREKDHKRLLCRSKGRPEVIRCSIIKVEAEGML